MGGKASAPTASAGLSRDPSRGDSGQPLGGRRSSGTFRGRPIGIRPLAQLMRRLGSSYRAGVDGRRIWDMEVQGGPVAQRPAFAEIRARIGEGESLAEAIQACRGVFPPLVGEMVSLGEHTGRLDTVLTRLADHYEHLVELRRNFLIGIAWPAIQLFMAVMIVAFLIGIFGWISERNGGETIDPLGFGLVGGTGLVIYFGIIGSLCAGFAFLVMAYRQGWLGTSVSRMLLSIPVVGNCMRINALARMAWTLSLALESGSEARRALSVSLRSTQLPYYLEVEPATDAVIERGGEFHEALRLTGRFPDDFLMALQSAEHAGAITDALEVISRDYSERAKMANRMLIGASTFLIWGGVAVMIIFLIFRLFMFYMGILNDALQM
jgi:type IV pilus assembly protein PilC